MNEDVDSVKKGILEKKMGLGSLLHSGVQFHTLLSLLRYLLVYFTRMTTELQQKKKQLSQETESFVHSEHVQGRSAAGSTSFQPARYVFSPLRYMSHGFK